MLAGKLCGQLLVEDSIGAGFVEIAYLRQADRRTGGKRHGGGPNHHARHVADRVSEQHRALSGGEIFAHQPVRLALLGISRNEVAAVRAELEWVVAPYAGVGQPVPASAGVVQAKHDSVALLIDAAGEAGRAVLLQDELEVRHRQVPLAEDRHCSCAIDHEAG